MKKTILFSLMMSGLFAISTTTVFADTLTHSHDATRSLSTDTHASTDDSGSTHVATVSSPSDSSPSDTSDSVNALSDANHHQSTHHSHKHKSSSNVCLSCIGHEE